MTTTVPPRPHLKPPLTPAQQALAADYIPLARAMSRPLKRNWPGARDEFDSAACLALVEAAGAYDPARNVRFATFARHRVGGALLDVQRRLIALGWRCDVANAPSVLGLARHGELRGRVCMSRADEPIGRELEALEEFEAWMRKLPPRHAAACRAIYRDGMTQTEAARRLGCSQSRLSALHREAISMLAGTWGLDDDAEADARRN